MQSIFRHNLFVLVAIFFILPGMAWAEQSANHHQPPADLNVAAAPSINNETPVQLHTSSANDDLLHHDLLYQGSAPARTFSTVLSYSLYGGALGALIGLGAYALSGFDWTPWTIAYFAGGGVVVGAGVGLAAALLREAQQPVVDSREWVTRDAPGVLNIPALRLNF